MKFSPPDGFLIYLGDMKKGEYFHWLSFGRDRWIVGAINRVRDLDGVDIEILYDSTGHLEGNTFTFMPRTAVRGLTPLEALAWATK